MASLLTNHARSLSHYRTLLSTTQAQLAAVQQTLSNVESALAEARADEVFWKRRVQELDRENRLQALELTSAKRGKREAEQELARVRVELEDVRRGVKRVRVGGVRDREVQTDEEDADWVGRCTCGAARGFLVVEEEDTVEDGRVSAAAVAERRGEAGDGDRERRRMLREKLRATRERVGGMRERAGERLLGAEEDGGSWRRWATAESTYTYGSRIQSRVV